MITPQKRPRTITKGLVGWWLFGDGVTNVLDYSGNASQRGVVSASAVPARALNGYSAFSFPNSGKITCGSSSLVTSNNVTVSCWFNPSVTTRCDLVTCWTNGGTAADQFNLLYGLTASAPQFFVSTGAANNNSNAATTIPTGKWSHVAGTFDKVNISVWVNGALSSQTANSSNLGTGAEAILIGNNLAGDGQTNGFIADTRVYNRALSPAEVFALSREWYQPLRLYPNVPMHVAAAAASGVVFRRSLSALGTRAGSRQVHG